MLDVEANNEMHGWLPGIGTVLVLSGVVFVALGFVATSAYYNVMGFPAALFPPDSAMLGLMGFLYGAPAILIVLLIPLTGLSGWIAGRTPWFRRTIADEAKKSRAIQSAMCVIAVLVATTSLVTRITTTGSLHIPHSTEISLISLGLLVFSCGAVIANAHPVKLGVVRGVFWVMLLPLFPSAILGSQGIAAYYGAQAIKNILAEQGARFSTVIPLEGGSYQPGKLIICSERFCGFHNGLRPTIVSLDGIKDIVP